jgi:hypothetical protein
MAFIDGCACHVWAIDGWVNDGISAAVNNTYANYTTNLFIQGQGVGANKNDRVAQIVNHVRQNHSQIVANTEAIIFGGFQNNTDSAPEHMWLVYDNYIYDTMPGSELRRKAVGSMLTYVHPACEQVAFGPDAVGFYKTNLSTRQYQVLQNANWVNDQYTPP